jgi:hypothetical protein
MSDTNSSLIGPTAEGTPEDSAGTVPSHSRTVGGAFRGFLSRLGRAILAVGPFAAALTVYSLVLDDLPDSWFTYIAVKYAFSALVALLAGVLIRVAAQYATSQPTAHPATAVHQIVPSKLVIPSEVTEAETPYLTLAYTAARLQSDFRSGDHNGNTIYGWSQYIGDTVPPSAIGTSYGLRLAIALDIRDPQINYGRIVESLIALERETGGWAASTQRDIGRPEATALVLGAAVRGGLDHARTVKYSRLLEDMIAADTVGRSRTTTLAVVVSTLADVAPEATSLRELARRLAGAARSSSGDRSRLFWGESLGNESRSSVAHTARAIVALKRAARVLSASKDLADVAEAGLNWLDASSAGRLQNIEEQLRRPVPGGKFDALVVGHFTAVWVARAFMAADDVSGHRTALQTAMREVMSSQERGVWQWQDDKPIWMAYQGASALRDYLLRGLPWPP